MSGIDYFMGPKMVPRSCPVNDKVGQEQVKRTWSNTVIWSLGQIKPGEHVLATKTLFLIPWLPTPMWPVRTYRCGCQYLWTILAARTFSCQNPIFFDLFWLPEPL